MSVKEALQEKFYEVSDAVIESYSYDLLTHKITMVFRINIDEESTEHVIEFLKVATAYHVNEGGGDSRKNISPPTEDNSYMEIDNITVLETPVSTKFLSYVDDNKWIESCKGGGNIVIETYDTTIILETAEVRVDGESFVIGDW